MTNSVTPSRAHAPGHETARTSGTQGVTQGHAAKVVTPPYREQGEREPEAGFVTYLQKSLFVMADPLHPRTEKIPPLKFVPIGTCDG